MQSRLERLRTGEFKARASLDGAPEVLRPSVGAWVFVIRFWAFRNHGLGVVVGDLGVWELWHGGDSMIRR